MTPAQRKELARQLSAAIRAGDLREVQVYLDVLDGKDQPAQQQAADDATPAVATEQDEHTEPR